MNKALVAKIGWRLLNEHESLWACVLRSKYHFGEFRAYDWLEKKNTWSVVWKSVVLGVREVVFKGLRWIIGDGKNICFWHDKWLSNAPLSDSIMGQLPVYLQNMKVSDLWLIGGGWDLTRISPFVTENKCLELAAVVVDHVTGAQDRLAWGGTHDGKFTVSSAYTLFTRDENPRQNMESLYDRIWQVQAPERVRVFLWLVSHQGIMTNSERYRRHLSGTDVCEVCKGGVETILHILRDCQAMSGIWDRIVPRRRRSNFFRQSLFEWLFTNLGDHAAINGVPWSTHFALGVWWGWKWWCGNVFGGNKLCRDRVRLIKDMGQEVVAAAAKYAHQLGHTESVERLIAWVAPCSGWFKLNTDGASHGNPGLAAAGGVLRSSDGEWCGGFALNIGRCSAPLAELWGVYYGLCIAWEKQVEYMELEVDSKMVVGFLMTGIGDSHPLSFLVRLCHGFLRKNWNVRISHVYREANRLADGLANYAFSLPLGLHTFDHVPLVVEFIMHEDALGTSFPRQIRL